MRFIALVLPCQLAGCAAPGKGDVRMSEVMDRIRAISERLKEEYNAEEVILFGSYARGEATEDSDVDLFIIAPTKERFFERMATVLRLTRDLHHKLALEPIVLTKEEVEQRLQRGDQFVKQITEKGVYL
jgi:predicted nucleotidyltransferase